ncbi:hypothetical protein [Campylobacter showae]|uniref:Uncharacterized protein n=1 Tax=Campylobacter showae RM3277 TaxID=553219 RepID=C6RDN4_9BACT|nr:hypothetical protein [Campylobacter showae]EET80431.1 hypothetical protein CAMSH0001_1191 [Campylobacter showae RM3277]
MFRRQLKFIVSDVNLTVSLAVNSANLTNSRFFKFDGLQAAVKFELA